MGEKDFTLAFAGLCAFHFDISPHQGNGFVEVLSFQLTVLAVLVNLNHRPYQFCDLADGQTGRG